MARAGTRPTGWCFRPGSTWSSCPPAAPELHPAERRWSLIDEPVANRPGADLDALEDLLVYRCQVLAADRQTIMAHTRDPWWPPERRPRRSAQ